MKATAKALLWILVSVVLLCSSCTERSVPSALEAITALCEANPSLPTGRFYWRHTSAPSAAHELSDRLLADLFGAGVLPPEIDHVQDAAVYLAFTEQEEYAVFLCKSRDDTASLSLLCQRRIDRLRRPYATEQAMPPSLQNASVTVRGRWVILCVTPDPDAAIRSLRRLF